MNTYVVIGATGNTGKPISPGLLEAGKKVRIVSRHAGNECTVDLRSNKRFDHQACCYP